MPAVCLALAKAPTENFLSWLHFPRDPMPSDCLHMSINVRVNAFKELIFEQSSHILPGVPGQPATSHVNII